MDKPRVYCIDCGTDIGTHKRGKRCKPCNSIIKKERNREYYLKHKDTEEYIAKEAKRYILRRTKISKVAYALKVPKIKVRKPTKTEMKQFLVENYNQKIKDIFEGK